MIEANNNDVIISGIILLGLIAVTIGFASGADDVMTGGMLRLTSCSPNPDSKLANTIIYVDPEIIAVVTDPPETGEQCVKVVSKGGYSLFVHGTPVSIVNQRARALNRWKE